MDVYQKAWIRLTKEIETKTGWGKQMLKDLMIECLINPDKQELERN